MCPRSSTRGRRGGGGGAGRAFSKSINHLIWTEGCGAVAARLAARLAARAKEVVADPEGCLVVVLIGVWVCWPVHADVPCDKLNNATPASSGRWGPAGPAWQAGWDVRGQRERASYCGTMINLSEARPPNSKFGATSVAVRVLARGAPRPTLLEHDLKEVQTRIETRRRERSVLLVTVTSTATPRHSYFFSPVAKLLWAAGKRF